MIDKEKIILAEEYFEKGYKLQLEGDLSGAIKLYTQSIETYPTPKAYNFLGWTLSNLGKYEQAIEQCKMAIELDPENGIHYNDIGINLIKLNKFDESIYWFKKALSSKYYSSKYISLYHLGQVFEKKGMWFTAIQYYNDSLEENPDYQVSKIAYYKLLAQLN